MSTKTKLKLNKQKELAKSTIFQAIANAVPKAGGQRALPTTSAQAILETVGLSVSEDVLKKSKKSVNLTAQEHLNVWHDNKQHSRAGVQLDAGRSIQQPILLHQEFSQQMFRDDGVATGES